MARDEGEFRKFTDKDEDALDILIQDQELLHEMAESRRFWTKVFGKLKWLGIQIGALTAAITALNEGIQYVLKWRHGS